MTSAAPLHALAARGLSRVPTRSVSSHIIGSIAVNLLATGVFLAMNDRLAHWFVIPTTLCGCICFAFLTIAAQRHSGFTDPSVLIAAVGYYNTYLAPMLLVHWDTRILALPLQPDDYRPWLGRLALIYLAGIPIFISVFVGVVRRSERAMGSGRDAFEWSIDRSRLIVFGTAFIVVSVVLQAYVYSTFGGVSGYMDAYLNSRDAFQNKGWLMAIAESGPCTGVLVAAGLRRQQPRSTRLWILLISGVVFLLLQVVFGGLRGSRANIVVKCYFAAGITHQVFRPLSRKALIMMAGFALAISYGYVFYKDFGLDGLRLASDPEQRKVLSGRSGHSMRGLLISDLSRADVHSYILQELDSGRRIDFAYGQTYLGALSLLIPRLIWEERLPTKLKWTTELEGGVTSSRMYGQLGEALLNFGYFGVPIAFTLMGLIIGRIAAFSRLLTITDARRLLLPALIITSACMVIQDSDNILYFVFQFLAIPFALIGLSTMRRHVIGARCSPMSQP